mmetsp:Transcript_42838/g.138066  ORF Transcript_42838/g.138066 Transcript_42838/m.138066 type:complete len:205 (+) Transcript_42838:311-925(+)
MTKGFGPSRPAGRRPSCCSAGKPAKKRMPHSLTIAGSARKGTYAAADARTAASCVSKWCQADMTADDWTRHGIVDPSSALSPLDSGMKAPPHPPIMPHSSGPTRAHESVPARGPVDTGGRVREARSEQIASTWYRKTSKPELEAARPNGLCSRASTGCKYCTHAHAIIMVGISASLISGAAGRPSSTGTMMPPPKEVSTASGIA